MKKNVFGLKSFSTVTYDHKITGLLFKVLKEGYKIIEPYHSTTWSLHQKRIIVTPRGEDGPIKSEGQSYVILT